MTFFETEVCVSGVHCQTCRHSEEFRKSILVAGLVEERDFACPFGESPPAFPTRFRKKGCGNCQPMTAEEMRITVAT